MFVLLLFTQRMLTPLLKSKLRRHSSVGDTLSLKTTPRKISANRWRTEEPHCPVATSSYDPHILEADSSLSVNIRLP